MAGRLKRVRVTQPLYKNQREGVRIDFEIEIWNTQKRSIDWKTSFVFIVSKNGTVFERQLRYKDIEYGKDIIKIPTTVYIDDHPADSLDLKSLSVGLQKEDGLLVVGC